jgi:hypothetical protein
MYDPVDLIFQGLVHTRFQTKGLFALGVIKPTPLTFDDVW